MSSHITLVCTISTQPLILMLEEEEKKGNVKGIPYGEDDDKKILFELFADGTGLFL